jgi:osmoprotectant transport system permease protein
LKILTDDRDYFPRYDAVLLYRADLARRHAEVVTSLLRLEDRISETEMVRANGRSELERSPEPHIAADFLAEKLGVKMEVADETITTRIRDRTIEHLDLVRKSLIPAILMAIPLGICAAKRPRFGQVILGLVGIVQTIPSLALLVILLAPMAFLQLTGVGVGSMTAVAALFLYSLLPIVRNTYAGLHDIASEYTESALSLGLPPFYRLMKIELPMASRSILAGIKTAAVLNVGFATLGALIGAGGYGQPIITGIRLADNSLILQGAIPAAILALVVQGMFELAERYFVPRGLRLGTGRSRELM